MTQLTDAMSLNMLLAFGAGFLSFVSPCVLPLFPAFLSYITGMSVSELQEENKKVNKRALIHTVLFLIGFSSVFIMIGFGAGLSSNFLADFFLKYQDIIRQVGAILIIFFGLVIVGILNFKFLMKNKTISFKNRPSGFFGSFLIGMAFSMGWTPCTGPILAIVIGLAATNPDQAMILMVSYVLGFAIPFLVLSFFVGKMKWIRKHNTKIVKIGGYIMIMFGVALFFDLLTKVTSILAEWTGFYGF